MPEQVAGAITREALEMAGFGHTLTYVEDRPENCEHYVIRELSIFLHESGGVVEIDGREQFGPLEWIAKEFDPPITTMARLMDEIEAFEESLKPKQEEAPLPDDDRITADQFLADGWEITQGGNFYKQGMHACWLGDNRTWRLLVGNDDTLHTSMKSIKARIRELIDHKYQWLL